MSEIRPTQGTARGTGRLPENVVVPPPAQPPAPPRAPSAARDVNGTAPLARQVLKDSGPLPAVDLDQLEVPEPPAPKKDDGFFSRVGRFLDRVGDGVEAGLDKVGDAAAASLDAGGRGVGATLEFVGAETAGQRVRETTDRWGDTANASLDDAGRAGNRALDTAGALVGEGSAEVLAEAALGPAKPQYVGEVEGALGAITSRLGQGDSVFLSGTAKVTLPSQTVAAVLTAGAGAVVPNLKGSFRATAMLSRINNDQLSLTLSIKAAEGAVYKAGFGFEAGVTVGDQRYGINGGVKGEAGIEATQTAQLTLNFDPNKPEDMARLQSLIGSGDAGSPLDLGVDFEGGLRGAMRHNLASTEIGASFGLKAEGEINATVGHGQEDGKGIAADSPMRVRAAGVLEGELVAGGSRRFQADGGTRDKFVLEAGLTGTVQLPRNSGFRSGVEAQQAFLVDRHADGTLKGLSREYTQAIGGGARGGLGDQANASMGETSAVTLKHQLTEQGVAAVEQLVARGRSPYDAFNEVAAQPGMSSWEKMTTEVDTFSLGFDVKAQLGIGEVKLELGATMGRSHREGQRLEAPDLHDTRIILGQNR